MAMTLRAPPLGRRPGITKLEATVQEIFSIDRGRPSHGSRDREGAVLFLPPLSKSPRPTRHHGEGDFTMQYLLMAYVRENEWPTMTKEQQEQGMAAYMAYGEALRNAGVIKGSNRLRPTSD